MKKRFGFKKLIAVMAAVAMTATAFSVVPGEKLVSDAMFNPDLAITFKDFKAKQPLDNSVIFYGTYIIHKDALTEQLYEKAKTSASDSGQQDLYYRSELSDGSWFITGDVDNGLKGISNEGVPVPEENLDPLYVEYYCGKDGILKDAKSLTPVNPFGVPDPYDLSKLPELDPLWMQYTNSQSATSISQEDFLKNRNSADSGKLRSDVYYYQILSTFFSLDLRDDQTTKCDQQLERLNKCYIKLKADGKEEEAALVYGLMEKVDATRRMIVMQKLSETDPNLLNTMYNLATGQNYTPSGSFKDSSSDPTADQYSQKIEDSLKHDFTSNAASVLVKIFLSKAGIKMGGDGWWTILEENEVKQEEKAKEANKDNKDYTYDRTPKEYPFEPDSALTDSISTAMNNCKESYNTNRSKGLLDSEDILGHAEYEYSQQVIDQASESGVAGPVVYLKHVTNIKNNTVGDAKGELELIKSSLMGLAGNKYSKSLSSGVAPEYAGLVSESAKSSALKDQKDALEADRSTVQFLIEGIRQRDTAANSLAFVYERIDWTEALRSTIVSDDFKASATSSLEAHLAWLKDEARKIAESDDSLKSKLDELKDKKEDLQKQRDKALDNNDLSGASALDAKIAAVDKDIAAEESSLSDKMTGTGSASDQAKAQNAAGGSLDSVANQLVDKALNKLADNADADLSGIADALAGIGAEKQLAALAEKAAASGASKNSLDAINDAQKEAAENNGSGSGSGTGAGGAGTGSGSGAGSGSGTGAGGSGSGAGTGSGGAGAGSGTGAGGTGSGSGAGGTGTGEGGLEGVTATAEELLAMLEELFGKSLDDMDDRELAVATSTMSRISRMGVPAAETATQQLTNRIVKAENKYVYTQYSKNKQVESINMRTLANCTEYRYFYDDTKATATMTSGSKIYIFQRGSKEMHKKSIDTDPETMETEIMYEGEMFIGEDDANNYFTCLAEYCMGTDYAICVTGPMQSEVEEMVNSLQEELKP